MPSEETISQGRDLPPALACQAGVRNSDGVELILGYMLMSLPGANLDMSSMHGLTL